MLRLMTLQELSPFSLPRAPYRITYIGTLDCLQVDAHCRCFVYASLLWEETLSQQKLATVN